MTGRPRVFIILGWVTFAVAIIYLVDLLGDHYRNIPAIPLNGVSVATMLFSVVLYGFAVSLWCIGWGVLLRATGERVSMALAASIVGVSQITKYIPGNVAQHVGRAALATRAGMNLKRVIATIGLEAGWIIAAGALCTLLAVAIIGPQSLSQASGVSDGQLLLVLAVAILVPVGFAFLLSPKGPIIVRRMLRIDDILLPGLVPSLTNLGLHFSTLIIQGAITLMLCMNVFDMEGVRYWMVTGAFAAGWVTGVIAPGAPAGLGVREAVMVAGLSVEIDVGTAIAVTALHRLINIVGDVFVFIVAYMAWRRASRKPA